MNKALKGCLIGCGVVVIIFVLIFGWIGLKITKSTRQYAADMEAVSDGYKKTNVDFPFTAPEDDKMDEKAFAEFVEIRDELIGVAYTKMGIFSDIGDATESGEPSIGDIFSSMKEIMRLPIEMGKAHTELLNEKEMSLDEYYWYDQAFIATMRRAEEAGDEFYEDVLENIEYNQSPQTYTQDQQFDWRQATGKKAFPNADQNLPILEAHRTHIVETSPELWVDITFMSFAQGIKQGGE